VRGQQALFVIVFSDSTWKVPREPPDSTKLQKAADSKGLGLRITSRQCEAAKVQCTLALTSAGEDAEKSAGDGGGGKKGALLSSRTTLQYTRDPALTALLKGLGKDVLGGGGGPEQSAPDTIVVIELKNVVADSMEGPTHLYVGSLRLTLPTNALARITLRPNDSDGKYDLPFATSISRNVENASSSLFGASLAVGLTLNAPDTTFEVSADTIAPTVEPKSVSDKLEPNIYILAHAGLARPQLPIRRQSLSLIVGTNIGVSGLFQDLLAGLSVDRLVEDAGVVIGLDYIQRQTAKPRDMVGGKLKTIETTGYRKWKVFLGLNFVL
jgi:hypothetical protein